MFCVQQSLQVHVVHLSCAVDETKPNKYNLKGTKFGASLSFYCRLLQFHYKLSLDIFYLFL
jgi:hypothetical protein